MDFLTKQKTYVILIIVLIVINLATLLILWINRPTPPPFKYGNKPDTEKFLKHELGLTDEQDKILELLRDELFNSTGKVMRVIDEKRKELNVESFKENPDSNNVEKLLMEIGNLEAQKEKFRFIHFTELKKVLSSEQIKKFRSMIEMNKRDRQDKFGEDHHGPPPNGEYSPQDK